MQKLTLSLLHFLIIALVSFTIMLGVAYATLLNEGFWLQHIDDHALVPTPATANSPDITTETNVTAAVLRSLPQDALQTEAKSFTTTAFAWLRGDTATLDYRPNLEAFRPQIAAALEKQYLQQLQTTPFACPASGVVTDPSSGVAIPCDALPQDPAALAKIYAESLADGVINQSTASESTPKSSSFSLPALYQTGGVLLWVLPVVALLSIIVTIALAHEKIRQLSYIGRHLAFALLPNLLAIGGGLLLLSWSLQILPQAVADLQQFGIGGLMRSVARDTAVLYLIVTALVMTAAIVVWLAARGLAQQRAREMQYAGPGVSASDHPPLHPPQA